MSADPGARFENLVASHLLEYVHYVQDTEGRDIDLCYFRDIDKREVDFVLTEAGNPIRCIECKLTDTSISSSLSYFKKRFPSTEAFQVVAHTDKRFRTPEGIILVPAVKFLQELV